VTARLPTGPSGLGTSAARFAAQRRQTPSEPRTSSGLHIPELYCPDPVRDDPALGEEVNNRLVDWAAEVGIYEGRLDKLREHNFGRLMMLAHPDCDDPDRLLAAARCGLAEWAVDDHYVDLDPEDAEPELIGLRLALCHAVVDPVRLPAGYAEQFEEVVAREPVLRAFRSCLTAAARTGGDVRGLWPGGRVACPQTQATGLGVPAAPV
jgi:2-methylisoborneol synthase